VKSVYLSKISLALAALLTGFTVPICAQEAPRAYSTTGPIPPAGAVSQPATPSKAANTIAGVPAYLWYHGCGPTALGMVVGYYDMNGCPDLIPGDSTTQTAEVNQVIASGGTAGQTLTPEQHNEDYAKPWNCDEDDYITQGRTPHADNCLADFAHTSRSTEGMCYGWGWSDDLNVAIGDYANYINEDYEVIAPEYYWPGVSTPELTFDILKTEIDNNRPMVFLVDSSGSGSTDHFVTVIGYDDGPPQKYIFYDTYHIAPQEAEFRGMNPGDTYGIWGGSAFTVIPPFQFRKEPFSQWKTVGSSLTLEVEVSGAVGEVSYQWVKDGTPLPGQTNNTYTMSPIAHEDEGWYTCLANDASKKQIQTTPAFIDVVDPEDIPSTGTIGLSLLILMLATTGSLLYRKQQRSVRSD